MSNVNLFFRKIANFNFSNKELFFLLILSQVILYFFFIPDYLIPYQINITGADAPSYRDFDFSNLKVILSQHRTFGLPLIIKIYEIFSETLLFWPQTNYIVFCISTIILLICLLNTNYNKLFSFFFVIGIFGSHNLYHFLKNWSEIYSACCIIISLSFFLLSLKYNKIFFYFLCAFFLFCSYQIRPSFIVYIFIFPLYVMIQNIILKNKKLFKNVFKFSSFTILPFILFVALRFIITDHFGITPFAGVNIAGHAVHYLSDKDVNSLSNEHKKFAEGVLERKKNHRHPCNLFLDELILKDVNPRKIKKRCFNVYVMSGWLEMIKVTKNLEPFPKNDYRNFNSWEHVETLGNFFTNIGNNNEIDSRLSYFAWELILKNYKFDYIKWLFLSFYESLYLQFYSLFKLIILYFISLIFFIFFKIIKIKKKNYINRNDKITPLL